MNLFLRRYCYWVLNILNVSTLNEWKKGDYENNCFLELLNRDSDIVVIVVDIFSYKLKIKAMDSFLLLISFERNILTSV